MIIVPYIVKETAYGAGKGVYLEAPVQKGRVLIAPDRIDTLYDQQAREAFAPGSPEEEACVRWFEDRYTSATDWPDDCYVNHSFSPSGQWHLGFVFARHDMQAGDEITMDYSFIVGDGEELPFTDQETGRKIIGKAWRDNIRESAAAILALFS